MLKYQLIFPVFLVLLLSGCGGGLQQVFQGLDIDLVEDGLIIAMMVAIEDEPTPEAQHTKAAKYRETAETLLAIAQRDGSLTRLAVDELIEQLIGDQAELPPSKRVLLSKVNPVLDRYTGGDGVITGGYLTSFSSFLEEVIASTELY